MAGGSGGDEPRAGGILREGYDYDFSRCDPTGAHVDPAWCAVYEVMTVAGPGGGLGSMIAESWQREQPDSPVWRIRIRPGVRFQSGDACDAAAVADALRLHADPVEAPINAFFWRNVKSIDSDGDGDVLIELHEPSVGMPRLLRSWHSAIHNQARRRLAGDDFGRTTCDGTGPFRFVECVPGSHLDVARWDSHDGTKTSWEANRGPAYLDGIRWVPILDDRDRAPALEDGEVDCIQNASLLDVDRLSANPELEVIEFQQSALVYLGLDHRATSLGFDDVRVRRAVSHAIDRHALVATDLMGHGWPAFGPIPSHSQWYAAEVEASGGFDPRKAAELLDAAGFGAGPDGVRFELEAVVVDDATVRRVSETIRLMLRAGGHPPHPRHHPRLRRLLRSTARAAAGVHLEVVLARAGRRDHRVHRLLGARGRPELPGLERRRDRQRLPRLGGRAGRRGVAGRSDRDPAARRRDAPADPALLALGGLGASPARAELAAEPSRSLSALRGRLAGRWVASSPYTCRAIPPTSPPSKPDQRRSPQWPTPPPQSRRSGTTRPIRTACRPRSAMPSSGAPTAPGCSSWPC